MSNFKYDAFLSYRHGSYRDRIFTSQLERFLESYRPDWTADKYTRNINIFRDVNDLSGNNLTEELLSRLDQSRYLIVICSKSSKSSKYIGKEISHFLSKRDIRYLILIVLDGDPSVDATIEESPFRSEIRDRIDEPFGYDFRRNGYRLLEFINRKLEHRYTILSHLTGVEKNLLIDRAKKRREFLRLKVFSAIVISVIGIFLLWNPQGARIDEQVKKQISNETLTDPNVLLMPYITANNFLLDMIESGGVQPIPLRDAMLRHNQARDTFYNHRYRVVEKLDESHKKVFFEIINHIDHMNIYLRSDLNSLINKFNKRLNMKNEDQLKGVELDRFFKTYKSMQSQLEQLHQEFIELD